MDLASNRLSLIKDIVSRDRHGQKISLYQCSCGKFVEVCATKVHQNKTKSCGCLKRDSDSSKFTKHGLCSTTDPNKVKMYKLWENIKKRCYVKEHPSYAIYGGKGITMSNDWTSDPEAFVEYISSLPDFSLEKSLDRLDGNLGYCKGNLRWATDTQQNRNIGKKKNNSSGMTGVCIEFDGKDTTRVVATWQDLYGNARKKSFSVNCYGLMPAFKMAVITRTQAIERLNEEGAGYSEYHGK